jgi:hypothetical protein
MRLAIVSSPRSGNSWLRKLLGQALGIPDISCHHWRELEASLPKECVIQLHWYREPGFQHFLAENQFQVIVLARHPMDILISVLRFCKYEKQTLRWLDGNCGIASIVEEKVTPDSEAFLAWCLGLGAENLLSISYHWAQDPSTICATYEGLVADPSATLEGILRKIGLTNGLTSAMVFDEFGPGYWKNLPNRHGWKFRTGTWRLFFTKAAALKIFERHRKVFEYFRYDVADAFASSTPENILRRWREQA